MIACIGTGDSGEACDAALESAYESATGKTFTPEDAAKLQKKGAATGSRRSDGSVRGGRRKHRLRPRKNCRDPTEKKEIREAYARALGKAANSITKTEFSKAISDGAKASSGLTIDACLEAITDTGEAKDTAIKACTRSDSVLNDVKAALGKPDMNEQRAKNFVQRAARGANIEELVSCMEDARNATERMACRGVGATGDLDTNALTR